MRSSYYNSKRIVLSVFTLLTFSSAFGQIQGDVADEKGKYIPGAFIIAIDSVRNIRDTTVADKGGFYDFYDLSPGRYIIEAKAVGFRKTVIRNIIVNVGDTGAKERDDDRYRGQRLNIKLISEKSPNKPGS